MRELNKVIERLREIIENKGFTKESYSKEKGGIIKLYLSLSEKYHFFSDNDKSGFIIGSFL